MTFIQVVADTDYTLTPGWGGGATDNGTDVAMGSVQVLITGTYLCYGTIGIAANGNSSLMSRVRVYTSPDNATWTLQSDSGATGVNGGTATEAHVGGGGIKLSLTATNYVQFRVFAFGSSGNNINGNATGTCHVQFIPTPGHTH